MSSASIRRWSSLRTRRCGAWRSLTSPSAPLPGASVWIEQRALLSDSAKRRGAFIGFGNVAANGHLPGWLARSDVEIVAASDATQGRREVFLAACPKGRWFDDAAQMIAAGGFD